MQRTTKSRSSSSGRMPFSSASTRDESMNETAVDGGRFEVAMSGKRGHRDLALRLAVRAVRAARRVCGREGLVAERDAIARPLDGDGRRVACRGHLDALERLLRLGQRRAAPLEEDLATIAARAGVVRIERDRRATFRGRTVDEHVED